MEVLAHIVATTENGMIGINDQLPWGRWFEDMRFFRHKTHNSIVFMGFKTVESLPKLLPNRILIGITNPKYDIPETAKFRDITQGEYHDVSLAMEQAETGELNELFKLPARQAVYIAGGEQLYNQTLKYVEVVYRNLLIPKQPIDLDSFGIGKVYYYPIAELEKDFYLAEQTVEHTEKGEIRYQTWRRKQ